MHTQERK